MAMRIRRSLMVSRGLQLVGAVLLVVGVVSCSQRDDPQFMANAFLAGFALIVGARVYEWMSKE